MSEEEAHRVYATPSANFMVLATPTDWWDEYVWEESLSFMGTARYDTLRFVGPFREARELEIEYTASDWVKVLT